MSALSEPTAEQAAHWMREVGILDALQAAELTPTSGPSRRRLTSLRHVALFLSPFDDLDGTNIRARINFLDPKGLSAWVRKTIGDAELADRMDEVIATGKAYAFLVPQLKTLVLERGSQCSKLLAPEPAI